MEQIAAEKSECHLIECWSFIFKIICICEGRVQNENCQQNLNEKYHCTFEEIVFKIFGQIEVNSNFIDHAEECKAVDTIVNSQQSLTIVVTKEALVIIFIFVVFSHTTLAWSRSSCTSCASCSSCSSGATSVGTSLGTLFWLFCWYRYRTSSYNAASATSVCIRTRLCRGRLSFWTTTSRSRCTISTFLTTATAKHILHCNLFGFLLFLGLLFSLSFTWLSR